MAERRPIKSGVYQFHHFITSLISVLALMCIVISLYSITNTISNTNKRNVKRSSRSLHQSSNIPMENLDEIKSTGFKLSSPLVHLDAERLSFDDMPEDSSIKKGAIKSDIFYPESSDYSSAKRHSHLRYSSRKTYDAMMKEQPATGPVKSKLPQQPEHAKLLKPVTKTEKDHNKNVEFPKFPENYHASGLLILPHSNIAEPFEIWYAPSVHKSRIDYYYGTDKTYQRADKGSNGIAYKYVPMFNDVQGSFDGCWTLTGTKRRPIIPQVITPNITWFTYNKTEVYTGAMTTKWTYQYYAYGMKNSQNVWITKSKPHRPIRYEMFGFDMMLGSYYDHYVLEYITFEDWDGGEDIFELPQGVLCYNWTNSLSSSLQVNPMQEFASFTPEKAIDSNKRYHEYKRIHKKNISTNNGDDDKRKHIYKHNIRYVHSHNRRNLNFKLKENQFLDMSKEELDEQHETLEKDNRKHKGIKDIEKIDKFDKRPPKEVEVPDELDWRDFGAVTHVKGQGICGSCYAFTAAAAAEAAWYRKTGMLVEVSTQQLVDCSWGYGNHGCKGGHYAAGLSWIFVHGISTQKSYGKYLGEEGYCHFNDTWFGAKIDGFAYIQPWNKTALKRAVAKYGPIAVSLNTSPLSFKFYSHGIYSDPACSANHTGHSALVIGYGTQNGEDYWLIKNSWSTTWGENGYIKVAMDDNLCGVTEYPIAVVVNKPMFHLPTKTKIKTETNIGMKHKPTNKESNENANDESKQNDTLNSNQKNIEEKPHKIDKLNSEKSVKSNHESSQLYDAETTSNDLDSPIANTSSNNEQLYQGSKANAFDDQAANALELPVVSKGNSSSNASTHHQRKDIANNRNKAKNIATDRTSQISFTGLHIIDAEKEELATEEKEEEKSEEEYAQKKKKKTRTRNKNKSHKIVKEESNYIPIIEVAKHVYHQVLAKEKSQKVEMEKQRIINHGKQLHHLVKQFGAVAEIKKNKPTINPENIGMYESSGKIHSQPKRPTIMGTKKQTIEHKDGTKPNSKPMKLSNSTDIVTSDSNYRNDPVRHASPHQAVDILSDSTKEPLDLPMGSTIASPMVSLIRPTNDTSSLYQNEDISTPLTLNDTSRFNEERVEEEEDEKENAKEEEEEQGLDSFLNKLESKIGSNKTQKHDKRKNASKILTNYEKASVDSMNILYSKIDKAVEKNHKNLEKGKHGKAQNNILNNSQSKGESNLQNKQQFGANLVNTQTGIYAPNPIQNPFSMYGYPNIYNGQNVMKNNPNVQNTANSVTQNGGLTEGYYQQNYINNQQNTIQQNYASNMQNGYYNNVQNAGQYP